MFTKPFVRPFGVSFLEQFGLNDTKTLASSPSEQTHQPSTSSNDNQVLSSISNSEIQEESTQQIVHLSNDVVKSTSNLINSSGNNGSVISIEHSAKVPGSTKRTHPNQNANPKNKISKIKSKKIDANFKPQCVKDYISQELKLVTSEYVEPSCVPVGTEYKIGKDTFLSKTPLFRIEMSDYTIITDAKFDWKLAPKELKPLLKHRWVYKLHIDQTLSPIITRSVLRDRVTGGQILAYRYTECSIAGNNCVYYGFIPTIMKSFEDSHNTCYVSSISIWPRKLYVYLKRGYTCSCSSGCSTWSSRIEDYVSTQNYCEKNIKWDQLYVMMGDYDETCCEKPKTIRSCEICAQCFDCSKSERFCRKHKVCKHKSAKPLEDVPSIVNSSMKRCKKYT